MSNVTSRSSRRRDSGSLGKAIVGQMANLTNEKVSTLGLNNAELNHPRIVSGKSVLALRKTPLMDSKGALVVAAGPSLHRRDVASRLKGSDFKGAIVATESALAYCLRHDIFPGLVVTLDPHPDRIVRWLGDPNLDQALLERDDYFARQDMDPKFAEAQLRFNDRSEERRVGKECRSRWSPYH